jgi:hypothetical protein
MTEAHRKVLIQLLRDIDERHGQMSCDEYEISAELFSDEVAADLIEKEAANDGGESSQGSLCDFYANMLEDEVKNV